MSFFDLKPLPVPLAVCEELSKLEALTLDELLLTAASDCSAFKDFAQQLMTQLETKAPALILKMPEGFPPNAVTTFRKFVAQLGHGLGELVVQNSEGQRLITVYDRDPNRTMAQGARYHQTHEGGSIHTDNVNIPEPWQYLILSCLAQAPVGGENILVNGDDVVALMRQNFPSALKILEAPFIWEKRGVSDELYEAPIITYDKKGHAEFRHLRPYMESAHKRADKAMTAEQIQAVDILDAYLNTSSLQARFVLKPFECLVSLDSRTLHGRTCFADALGSVDITQWENQTNAPKRRTMERLWVRRQA